MIGLINEPQQQQQHTATGKLYFSVDVKQQVCLCVCIWLCSFVSEDWRKNKKQKRGLGQLFPQQMNSRCLLFTLKYKTSISWELAR